MNKVLKDRTITYPCSLSLKAQEYFDDGGFYDVNLQQCRKTFSSRHNEQTFFNFRKILVTENSIVDDQLIM